MEIEDLIIQGHVLPIVAVVRDAVLLCATRCFMQSVMLCCCAQCCALCSRQDGTRKARWKNSERSVCSAFLAGHVIEQFCSVYTIFLTSWTFEQFLQRPACAFDFLLL